MLNERHQDILRATIKHYISTAEPVGSRTLLEEYNFNVSSATIRNILGNLEKAGFLYQPHTSSGRVPSDSGYRIYVDHLITFNAQKMAAAVEKQFNQQLKWDSWNLEILLQRAAHILANLSGCITLISMPQTNAAILLHLQLVQISSKSIMLVVVTDTYQTQSILLDTSSLFAQQNQEFSWGEELQLISNFLNSHLRGKNIQELLTIDWSNLDQQFNNYAEFIKTLIDKITINNSNISSSQPMMISGLSEVLRQPEFSQLDQLQMLLCLLEEQPEQLLPLILDSPAQKVSIKIGSENPLEPMRSCALISAIYKNGKIPVGRVGVIGPTRILYENVVPLVESAADYISGALSS